MSSAGLSRSLEKASLRHASRTRLCAAARSPCSSESAGERELALGGDRLVLGEEGAHGRWSGRSAHSVASARRRRQADRGPARIFGDESGVAGKLDAVGVVAAQDGPFHELARERVADGSLQIGRLRDRCPCERRRSPPLRRRDRPRRSGPSRRARNAAIELEDVLGRSRLALRDLELAPGRGLGSGTAPCRIGGKSDAESAGKPSAGKPRQVRPRQKFCGRMINQSTGRW